FAFSLDGRQLACSAGSEARLWDVGNGKEVRSWKLPLALQDRLAFHPSGKLLLYRVETKNMKELPASGADPREQPRVCRIRNLMGLEWESPLAEISDFNWHVLESVAAPDASYYVGSGAHGAKGESRSIKVFDGLTGKALRSFPSKRTFSDWVPLDPRGKMLLIRTHENGTPTLVEIPSGKLLGSLEHDALCLGPDAQ